MGRVGVLFVALVVMGCAVHPQAPALPTAAPTAMSTPSLFALSDAFAALDRLPGWAANGTARSYNRATLFDLVDGQADAFFAYRFEQVVTQSYANASGAIMRIEIWQLASPADAFGLFTFARSGTPVDIGNEGDADSSRRIAFWQHRYYVQVSAQQKSPNAELWTLARALAAALPVGGEPPAIASQAPIGERVGKIIFFRQEISIQSEIWLGGKNILGLGPETEGIVAQYDLDGTTARLLMVQYLNAKQSAAGLQGLQTSTVKNLVAADARGNLLAAVFGKVDRIAADRLLGEAFGEELK